MDITFEYFLTYIELVWNEPFEVASIDGKM
jgi:hypothetical protein